MLLPVLLVGPALAHLPHDVVVAVAAPAQLDDSAPWTLVADSGSVDLLLRSEDGGHSWFFVGGPPTVDDLGDAALLDDGWTALLGQDRLWWSDDGLTWQIQSLAGFDLLEARGDTLVVAGRDGVASLVRGGQPQLELDLPVQYLGPGVAVDTDGGVWLEPWTDGGSWQDLGVPAADTRSAVRTDAQAWAGTRSGAVWRHDGDGWSPCGALPDTGGLPDVVELAHSQAVLFAAPAGRAPLVSFDGCATWEERDGLFTLYDTDGGATGPDQAIGFLRAAGDRVVVGGWAGLALSDDLAESWTDAPIIPPDATRGLAFSPDFETDHTIYVGSYTGGVLRSANAGHDFTSPSLGLESANVQGISVHPKRASRLVAVVGHRAWSSEDAGLRWQPMDTPFDYVAAAWAYDRGAWAIGRDGAVAWKGWTRPSWWTPPAPKASEGLSQVVLDGLVTKCVSSRSEGALRCLGADNSSWQTLLAEGEARMTAVVQATDGSLVVGHGARILDSGDEGASWQQTLQLTDDELHTLARTPDHRVLAGTRAGLLLLRQDDGSWTDLGVALPAAAQVIAPRPDFDQHPQVLVGTWAGTFVVDIDIGPDAHATAEPFAAVQWVDDHTDGLCASCDSEPADGASFGRVSILPDGQTVGTSVRGEQIAVRGRLPAGSLLHVDVRSADGQLLASELVRGPSDGVTRLWSVDDLPDGWHQVSLVGHGGAQLDAVIGQRAWSALAVDERPVLSEGCGKGCSSVPAGPWWLAGLVLVPVVRRRRPGLATTTQQQGEG